MPQVNNAPLYNLIYTATQDIITQGNFAMDVVTAHTPLYRYTSYRRGNPQEDQNARTIYTRVNNDTSNRWTGLPPTQATQGTSGLYLSMEEPGAGNTEFPELEHYQKQGPIEPDYDVYYWEYWPQVWPPNMIRTNATQLRSMFLMDLKEDIKGYDLTMPVINGSDTGSGPDYQPSALLYKIFITALNNDNQQIITGLFNNNNNIHNNPNTYLANLYYNPTDASFCRAIGNAIFVNAGQDCQFIKTTSARNKKSVNLTVKGEIYQQGAYAPVQVPPVMQQPLNQQPMVINYLSTQGRGTFFLTVNTNAVVTIDDMTYNAQVETQLGLNQ